MSVEEFLGCFDTLWCLHQVLCAVAVHVPAEVDSKVCQGFTFFNIWQDLHQQKKP